jgi:hypothetical protein
MSEGATPIQQEPEQKPEQKKKKKKKETWTVYDLVILRENPAKPKRYRGRPVATFTSEFAAAQEYLLLRKKDPSIDGYGIIPRKVEEPTGDEVDRG